MQRACALHVRFLSDAGHSHNKLGLRVEHQADAVFLVVAGDHRALWHRLDLKIGVHFLKFSFSLVIGLANKFGVGGLSCFVGRHCPASEVSVKRAAGKI